MYFDEPAAAFDRPIGREMQAVLVVSALVILFFFAWPGLSPMAPMPSPRRCSPDEPAGSLPSFYRLVRHERVASTSDEAKTSRAAGVSAGTLVWARAQSAGRGRQGRNWVSPVGNLYRLADPAPAVPVAIAAQLGFVAALAVADACSCRGAGRRDRPQMAERRAAQRPQARGHPARIRQAPAGRGALDWLVAGIGINLATYPVDVDYPATALAATGADATPETMLPMLAAAFLAGIGRWERGRRLCRHPRRRGWRGRAASGSRSACGCRVNARRYLRRARQGRRLVAR